MISAGYQTAPEAKFPVALEQCYDSLLWVAEHAQGRPIAIIGDSAGGNLTAALCLLARDRIGPRIALQILLNPAINLTQGSPLTRQNDELDPYRYFVSH